MAGEIVLMIGLGAVAWYVAGFAKRIRALEQQQKNYDLAAEYANVQLHQLNRADFEKWKAQHAAEK
jgi:hypothetical protein